MKKVRTSTAVHNEQLAEKLAAFKRRITMNLPKKQQTTAKHQCKKVVKKQQKNVVYDQKIIKIEKPKKINGDTVIDRAQQHLIQWCASRKIDYNRVREEAYKLNTNMSKCKNNGKNFEIQ